MKEGHDGRDQHQIGGEHRQGPAQLLPSRAQVALIVPAKKGAGPVEHKGDGKAHKQRLTAGQHLPQQRQNPVKFHQGQHQQHCVGNDHQNTLHPLLRHTILHSRLILFAILCITIPCPPPPVNIPGRLRRVQKKKAPGCVYAHSRGVRGNDALPAGTWWPERCEKAKLWEESREV